MVRKQPSGLPPRPPKTKQPQTKHNKTTNGFMVWRDARLPGDMETPLGFLSAYLAGVLGFKLTASAWPRTDFHQKVQLVETIGGGFFCIPLEMAKGTISSLIQTFACCSFSASTEAQNAGEDVSTYPLLLWQIIGVLWSLWVWHRILGGIKGWEG